MCQNLKSIVAQCKKTSQTNQANKSLYFFVEKWSTAVLLTQDIEHLGVFTCRSTSFQVKLFLNVEASNY